MGGAPAYVPVYGPGYGRWRLEIEPETPARTDYMLNVLKPALDAGEKLPPIRKMDGEGTFGAEIAVGGRTYTVLFPKDSLAAPQLSIR